VIEIAIDVLPQAKVVNWMMTFGASFSDEMARFVSGRRSDEGNWLPSHAFMEAFLFDVLGRKSERFLGQVAVTNGMPISVEVLYVTQMRW